MVPILSHNLRARSRREESLAKQSLPKAVKPLATKAGLSSGLGFKVKG